MKTKKLLALLMAGAMSVSVLSGCGGSAAKTDDSSADAADTSASAESDVDYVKSNGKLVIGITDFAPMDYKEDGSDEWVGFDADMAKAFAESLGVKAEFIEINWDNKIMELDSKGVDAVWNGMTLTDEVKTSMNCSDPYATNAQVVVVPSDKADAAKDIESIKDMTFAVESGSAGEAAAQAAGLNATAVQSQADALMEVAAGTSDACVIDLLMAGAMIGEGTSYPNLTYTVNLNEANGEEDENYVVGFRKGSDLTEAFNNFYKGAYKDGVVLSFAQKKRHVCQCNTQLDGRLCYHRTAFLPDAGIRSAARSAYQLRLDEPHYTATRTHQNHRLDRPRHTAHAPDHHHLLWPCSGVGTQAAALQRCSAVLCHQLRLLLLGDLPRRHSGYPERSV